MATTEVRLWGRRIGAAALGPGQDVAAFEYDPDFQQSGIELSPIVMPLSHQVYTFPELSRKTFHGLPGLLADSLPDRFGNALINQWLAQQGRTSENFSALDRLCYTGNRGMGALEFRPVIGPRNTRSERLEVDRLVALASAILSERENLQVRLEEKSQAKALKDILRVGTSAGGARAKAVIAWNPQTHEIRSGQINAGSDFQYWLLKFDGVRANKDKELEDPKGYGAIEYAYHLMCVAAGIEMNPCQMLKENDRRHFMTKRFDRKEGGEKLHMQSLCALGHYDFNQPGAHSYEQAFLMNYQLGLGANSAEQMYRRMIFNIVGRNQDDHVKNIAFLMDKSGQWSLSPAFDMSYSYNPAGAWTNVHQMSVNGKRDDFTMTDFREIAKVARLKQNGWKTILDEVRDVIRQWADYAAKAEVSPAHADRIGKFHRLTFPDK